MIYTLCLCSDSLITLHATEYYIDLIPTLSEIIFFFEIYSRHKIINERKLMSYTQ